MSGAPAAVPPAEGGVTLQGQLRALSERVLARARHEAGVSSSAELSSDAPSETSRAVGRLQRRALEVLLRFDDDVPVANESSCFDVESHTYTKFMYGNQRRGSGKKRPSGRYGQRGGMQNPNVQWHSMKAQAEREGWLPQFRQMFPHRSAMSSWSNRFEPGTSSQH